MLRLTLYQNCIITSAYNEVFAYQKNAQLGQSTLEQYLATLTNKVFDIDDVYQEDSGQFIFELSTSDYTNIYNFNYMKIEVVDGLFTRFAFIDDIKIKNEVAVLSYSLDYYHSFVRSIGGINSSLLKGLRVCKNPYLNPNYKVLPVDYAGNNELEIYPYNGNPHAENDNTIIIVEFQVYDTEKYGEGNSSEVKYGIINKKFGLDITTWTKETLIPEVSPTFKNTSDFINDINRLQSKKNYNILNLYSQSSTPSDDYKRYYKIGNIYVIPYRNIINSLFASSNKTSDTIITDTKISGNIYFAYQINYLNNDSNIRKVLDVYLWTFPRSNHNYRIRGIGLYTKFIPVAYNGTIISVKEQVFLDNNTFRYYLNVENKIVEITECFQYFVPYTELNGEVLAQQKISRELQNAQIRNKSMNLLLGGVDTVVNEGFNLAKQYGNFEGDIAGSVVSGIGGNYGGMVGSAISARNDLLGMGQGIIGTATSLLRLNSNMKLQASKFKALNAPVYNSTTLLSANNSAILNAKYDICEFVINADNGMYVNDVKNLKGYIVFEILTDLSSLGLDSETYVADTGANYNAIQFGTIDIYGKFPTSVALILNQIFINGFKIWYDPTRSPDNYN